MTSFVNMFSFACYTCNYIRRFACSALSSESAPLAASWSSRRRACIKYKLRYVHTYLSVYNVSLSDWFHLEGKNGELVVKDWRLSTPILTGSHLMCLTDLTAGRNCYCLKLKWSNLPRVYLEWWLFTIFRSENSTTTRGIICFCNLLLRSFIKRIY